MENSALSVIYWVTDLFSRCTQGDRPFVVLLQAAHNDRAELGEGRLSASSDLFVNEISLLY